MECVNSIDYEDSTCLGKCEGMDIISYNEHVIQDETSKLITKLSNYYNNYKQSYNTTKFSTTLAVQCKINTVFILFESIQFRPP